MQKSSYKRAGVNITKADGFVGKLKSFFKYKDFSNISAFGSPFYFKPLLKKYPKPVLVSSTDGVGTKLKIAQQFNIHHTIGQDLVAMNVNDIICLGAKPLFFLDYIACGKLKAEILQEVFKGINKGLSSSDCFLLGGETAEMPGMYKKDEYDLAGFCVGAVDKDRIIDGSKIKEGDLILGLESSGLHSNGFSLVRAVLNSRELKKQIKEVLQPTRIYVEMILSLLSVLETIKSPVVKGIAHVTGGAYYSKVTKILPPSLGMVINKNSWKIPKIFKTIQEKGHIDEREMYSVFNMGIGMILVVDKNQANKVINYLNKKVKSYLLGEIIKSSQKMTLI
ncbi:MAG: phosphoribosylformylglycinamidine cyclo-ligase [Candidatus Omnitrophica bacterium]|jgi:phosphoribosylformylglycinamidine cyclo-ligase|nr:phosphoribosylformylglycinamidine cyclo-ligase [Candidatus Omnitrophota bacterium]